MSESDRVQRWRQRQRSAGKDALTIWLPRELKLYIEDIALKRHCSPSDLVEQALTTCYPLSADVTDTVTDTSVTDTSQLRLVLQQELQALLYERQPPQGAQAREEVAETVTDTVTVMSQLRTVVEQAVWDSMDKWQQYQHLPVVPIATATVTDTSDQIEHERVAIRALQGVTDTITDTQAEPALDVTDTVTDTESVTDTVTVTGHALEPFDTAKYVLGKLCPRNHDYQGTGQSLLRRTNRHCCACDREKFHERKQAKRQATAP